MKTEREYRNCTEFRADNSESGDTYTVTGYATTFGQPYTLYADDEYELREVVDPHAFDGCDMSDVIMQYDHSGRVFARVKNGTLSVMPDAYGLAIRAELGQTSIGRQLYEEIKGGYTNKMSFGFVVTGSVNETTRNAGEKTIITRRITQIGKLYDVSAVSLPANDQTSICARRLFDGAIEKIEAERLSALEIEKQKLILKLRMEGLK